ncbi:A-kinase anchor protein 12b isoform X1 [Osmerus eperlanus]|uniref:A-kinase anchor protein 12b isoform X1 n=1 Tax=Osmerus eperlanus TaxID=29151 RepID=UPI002E0FD793
MGAQTSAQRDGKTQEDASAEELSAEVNATQEDSAVDAKLLQKNGQISSISSLNGHSEDNSLAEVGQTDGGSQKEEVPETMDTLQGEVAPQVNGEKEEKGTPDADDITAGEEKAAEEKPGEANEVGFKKIFRFVGFKFTLKKDKNEKTEPVQLLTVKDKDGEGEASGSEEVQEEVAAEEKGEAEGQAAETEAPSSEATPEAAADVETPADAVDGEAASEEAPKEEGEEEGQKECEDQAGSLTSPPSQEVTQSPFRKFFTQGIFSNLRKKASIKKPKEEEPKEGTAEEEVKEGEEGAEEREKAEVVKEEVQVATPPEESTAEVAVEDIPIAETATTNEVVVEVKAEAEVAMETPAPAAADTTDEAKPAEEIAEEATEGDKAPAEVAHEAELLSSQEKTKAQGSPLKKLFTGAGLKKRSTKKQKAKKDAEAKLTESGEQASEQLQSSTESTEGQKVSSSPSSPEDSGEHIAGAEASQAEAGQEAEGEGTTSDGEKKKEGILPWSSFKKLVTPKKRVKRPSESEDEAPGDKAKTATLSSTESTVFMDKPASEEIKPSEEELKTENAEKLESSTEEPKKKMDTSVSWEALMCMGGKTKRTRRTSDSDDDETKIEEEVQPAGEEKANTTESPLVSSQEAEPENTVSSPEPHTSTSDGEAVSTWESLKRFVIQRRKSKTEERTEEAASSEQVLSDSEIPKEESSFSLRKLIPGRKKKKLEKQFSSDVGSGEEDSDTPGVVPLSEYDNEPQAPTEETSETAPAKVSSEDRSPSWISTLAVAEEVHEPLSDIPEEGDNAATPKSADTSMAEDIVDLTTEEALAAQEKVPELSAVEVTELLPATPAGETTPVPDAPESESVDVVLEEAAEVLSEIPSQSSVPVETVPLEEADTNLEPQPPIDFAEVETKLVLMAHVKDEATAICTGLGTKEIAKLAIEKPVTPVVECVSVVSDALVAEVPLEDKAEKIEEAVAAEDPVFKAQVEQVETTELEPALENTVGDEKPETENASEGKEPEIIKVAVVHSIQTAAEIVQPPVVSENTPRVEMVDPIEPTVEEVLCTETVQVTSASIVEGKSEDMEVEQIVASEENAAVGEVTQAAVYEMVTSMVGTSHADEAVEAAIAVVAPTEEFATAKETVCLVAPLPMEPDQVEVKQEAMMENASVPQNSICDIQSQVLAKDVLVAVAELGVEGDTEAAKSEVSGVIVEVTEKIEEDTKAEEEASTIEEQGMVIAQVVIQNALDKVAENESEEEKPATLTTDIPTTDIPTTDAPTTDAPTTDAPPTDAPTTDAPPTDASTTDAPPTDAPTTDAPPTDAPTTDDPTPVQAVLTIEKEVKKAPEEQPVITGVSVVNIQAEKPAPEAPAEAETATLSVYEAVQVMETIEVEVIDEEAHKEPEETVKPEVNTDQLNQAVEVNVCEEKVEEVEEEVREIPESQMNGKSEEIKKENDIAEEVLPEASPTEIKDIQPKVQHAEVKEVSEAGPVEAVTQVLKTPSQPEEKKEAAPVVLQATEVVEEQAVEELQIEAVVEFDSTGVTNNVDAAAQDAPAVATVEMNMIADQEPALEEAENHVSTDTAVTSQEAQVAVAIASPVEPAVPETEKASAAKCAEVMAQVIEVIEEAVKEIEPVSTELTAAS